MNGKSHEVGTGSPSHSPVDEDAARIGERTLATWQGFDAAMAPIIGSGGVAALYRRSLFLSHAQSPWLPGVHEGALDPVEFTELQAAIALRPAAEAQAAADALIKTFRELLAKLIGPSLTERLLRPVSAPTLHGHPVQDKLP